MKTYKIHMIRHGITQGNVDGTYIGVTDLPLCQQGIDQIEELIDCYEYPRIQKVYSSPLKRAVQTAQLIYPDHLLQTIDALGEYNFGVFENRTMDDLKGDPRFLEWMENEMTVAPEGGESKEQFDQRLDFGFEQLLLDMMDNEITSAALVTHGGVMMSLLAKYGLPRREPLEWTVESGKGYTVMTYTQLWVRDSFFEVYDPLPYGVNDPKDPDQYHFVDVDDLADDEE